MPATTVQELDEVDLDELGITTVSDFHAAYRVNADTINVVVIDQDGAYSVDRPKDDNSGEDAWEWIDFHTSRDRDAWIEGFDAAGAEDPLVWIERYEHGLVRYAPIGEASSVDRRWDVASGVAVIRFTKPEAFGTPLLEVARSICKEYTSWCNGDIYGIVTYRRVPPVDAPNLPMLIPDEYATDRWVEADTSWGHIGTEYAESVAKEEP